jgi:hypothetical protein
MGPVPVAKWVVMADKYCKRKERKIKKESVAS